MQTVNRLKKAWKENTVMQFVNQIFTETEIKTNVMFGDALSKLQKEHKYSACAWYPMFPFRLGYAQAIQDTKRSTKHETNPNT